METETQKSQIPFASSASSAVKGLTFAQAESAGQIAQARELFLEYAQSLGFSLCFQNFDKELATLPGVAIVGWGKIELRFCAT